MSNTSETEDTWNPYQDDVPEDPCKHCRFHPGYEDDFSDEPCTWCLGTCEA